MKVGLGDYDRAGVTQFLDDKRIVGRLQIPERHRATGGGHVGGMEVVLQHYRDAVQRALRPGGLVEAIHLGRGRERAPVDRDDRVQRRAAIVVGVDAIEVMLHHLRAGGLPGIKGAMDGANRGFVG